MTPEANNLQLIELNRNMGQLLERIDNLTILATDSRTDINSIKTELHGLKLNQNEINTQNNARITAVENYVKTKQDAETRLKERLKFWSITGAFTTIISVSGWLVAQNYEISLHSQQSTQDNKNRVK